MDRKSELLVGVFFFVGIGLLFVLSARVSDTNGGGFLGRRPKYKSYFAKFQTAEGLKVDDQVFLAGMQVGQIKEIKFTMEAVEVWFEVDVKYPLFETTPVTIASSSLLGGRRLSMGLPGSAAERGERLEDGEELTLRLERDLFGSITGAATEIKQLIQENRENLKLTIANLRRTTEQLNQTGNVVGNLLNDREMADNLKKTFARLNTVSDNLESITTILRQQLDTGKGLLAKLIADEETARKFDQILDRLQGASKNIDQITAKINDPAGEGLISRLIHDKELADSVTQTIEKIQGAANEVQTLVADAREGDGRLGAILENVKEISADVREMVAKVKRGEGSLGQLVMNDDIANNLNKLLGGAAEAVEDAREQAPISAFGAVLLGGVQ